MKKIFYFVCAIAMTFGFTACKDEPDKFELTDGLPTINYIRPADIASSDSLLTQAYMQAQLCIVGSNLTSIREMYFNDVKATLVTSYITDNTLLVSVPNSIPKEVSNKIYMITNGGDTVKYDFHVIVPPPTISSMSCEYARPGSIVTLVGDYFIDDPNTPLTVTFKGASGDVTVPTDDINVTKTAISFYMPEGASEGPVEVSTIYGKGTSTFYYLDTRGMMFDFDGATGLTNRGWHDRTITTDNTAITGNYVQLGDGKATMSESGGWDDSQFSFEYWPGDWTDPVSYPAAGVRLFDLVDFSDWENMAIKFEMYIPSSNPWKAGAMQVIMAGTDRVSFGNAGVDIYGNTVAGCNNSYLQDDVLPRAFYRPWTNNGSYDTANEWVTVTLPIKSSFTYGFSGASATGSLSETDFASLVIFVVEGGVKGTECNPIIRIDNIRAVPN